MLTLLFVSTDKVSSLTKVVASLVNITFTLQSYLTSFNPWGFIGLMLGAWIIIGSLISIILKYKFSLTSKYIKSII